MTRQYIAGELSALLAELEPVTEEALRDAVARLRHEVELCPLSTLPEVADQALNLTDVICRSALEHGDVDAFRRCATTASGLREFAVDAGLLP